MFKQEDFSPLWEFETEIRSEEMTIKEAEAKCLKLRKQRVKELKESGFTTECFTLKNQLRKYWEMGVPCNRSCDCFFLNSR